MVATREEYQIPARLEAIATWNRVPASDGVTCPHCDGALQVNYDELKCLCGYRDPYRTVSRHSASTFGFGGREIVLRYGGDCPALRELTLKMIVQRGEISPERTSTRLIQIPYCPWCGEPMAQCSLSGKRREILEERFRCELGHRISVTVDRRGKLVWR